jgi:hypothetical protein
VKHDASVQLGIISFSEQWTLCFEDVLDLVKDTSLEFQDR